MTNREWLRSLSNKELTKLICNHGSCYFCSYRENKCIDDTLFQDCENGICEWLNSEHDNPMPEIRIGDAVYSYYRDESRAMFIVMSNIHASDSHGVIVRWRELDRIWKIARMNDAKEMLEVIWRADNDR